MADEDRILADPDETLAMVKRLMSLHAQAGGTGGELANLLAQQERPAAPAPDDWAPPPIPPTEPDDEEAPRATGRPPRYQLPPSKAKPGAPSSAGVNFVQGMVKRGWTPEEAAGVAGNIFAESSFRPDAVSKDGGYGFMQWGKDRFRGLQNYAGLTGRDWKDPETQMDWIHLERTGQSVKYGGSNESGNYAKAFAGGGAATDIAERFGRLVERPANLAASLARRQDYAARFGGATPTTVQPGVQPGEATTTTPVSQGPLPSYPAAGFVFHHSGGSSLDELRNTLQKRHLGSQYLMDRDGTIYSFAGPGSSHIEPNDKWHGIAKGLTNKNAVGMEIVAKDDSDVTPAQVAAARRFIDKYYPGTPVYGHGEVNPGHKQEDEGMTVVRAIRDARSSTRADRGVFAEPANAAEPNAAYAYNSQFAKNLPPETSADPSMFRTKLREPQERLYRKWLDATRRDTGTDLNPDDPGYDMRGYWKDVVASGQFKRMGKGQHFPDTYKTPFHPTFSHESKYATEDAPYWNDQDQLIDRTTGQPTAGYLAEKERENAG